VLYCSTLLSVTCAAPAAAVKENPGTDTNGAKALNAPQVEAAAAAVADPAAAGAAGAQRNQNGRASPIVDYITLLFSKMPSVCFPNGHFTIGTSFGSLDTCAQACLLREDCASFVYNSNFQTCELKYAVSGHVWARYRYANAHCTTYYRRLTLQISPTSIADGRAYYQNMAVQANHDNATTYCRSRGLHVADIRSQLERTAATNAQPANLFWMNLFPSFTSNPANIRYRDDIAMMSAFVTSFAPNGLHSSVTINTAYCAVLYLTSHYLAPDCSSIQNVVCQYSDLDRF